MKKKTDLVTLVVLVILIIALIVSFAYVVIKGNPEKLAENTVQNTVQNTTNTNNENNNEDVIENTTEVNNTENDVNENANVTEDDNEAIEQPAQSTEESRRTTAENLVKEKWGTEDGVYFSADGMDAEGKYIVNVRDSNTTAVYATYLVDVDSESTEEYN